MTPDSSSEKNFRRNTLGITIAEAFWGLGLPVLVESTFLQIFMKNLGASDTAIGLMPGLFAAGIGIFAVFASLLTSHLKSKKGPVIITHVISSFPAILYGVLLMNRGYGPGSVEIFLAFYLLFSFTIGITLPVWLNYISAIFRENQIFRAHSVMLIAQISCRFIGGLAIAKFVEIKGLSAESMGICFIVTGVLLMTGSLMYMITREEGDEDRQQVRAHSLRSLAVSMKEIITEKNYMLFQLSNIDIYACVTIITFYANYAVVFHGIEKSAAAGLFIASIQAGAVLSHLVLGWFSLFNLKSKYYYSKICGLSAVSVLLLFSSFWGFIAAGALLGMSRGGQTISYTPAVKLLSGRKDATDYFALTPLMMLPFSFGVPFSAGLFLEYSVVQGETGYRVLFAAMGLLIFISFLILRRVRL
jgi:MFS family permease